VVYDICLKPEIKPKDMSEFVCHILCTNELILCNIKSRLMHL